MQKKIVEGMMEVTRGRGRRRISWIKNVEDSTGMEINERNLPHIPQSRFLPDGPRVSRAPPPEAYPRDRLDFRPERLTCAARASVTFQASRGFLFHSATGLCTPLYWLEADSAPEAHPVQADEGDLYLAPSNCGDGFQLLGDSDTGQLVCLRYFVGDKKNYTDARDLCTSLDSLLVTVKTPGKLAILRNLVTDGIAWIGLECRDTSPCVWTSDGSLLTDQQQLDNFKSGEPNIYPGKEECGIYWFADKKLVDGACLDKMDYICNEFGRNKTLECSLSAEALLFIGRFNGSDDVCLYLDTAITITLTAHKDGETFRREIQDGDLISLAHQCEKEPSKTSAFIRFDFPNFVQRNRTLFGGSVRYTYTAPDPNQVVLRIKAVIRPAALLNGLRNPAKLVYFTDTTPLLMGDKNTSYTCSKVSETTFNSTETRDGYKYSLKINRTFFKTQAFNIVGSKLGLAIRCSEHSGSGSGTKAMTVSIYLATGMLVIGVLGTLFMAIRRRYRSRHNYSEFM
ncbi:hypothetical protein EGW08_020905 [Elysia chlorotica]|uniref:C-type lectin domain-containing protein n=1 Tax=Elysia chlorotica TaxID=188477 RepID=A0A3S1AT27_ELYCH|nr:hypothetical protein EGW08_020905 [Elysia chlorotica]